MTLTGAILEVLTQAGITPQVGATWTIDALYRETVAEVQHYQQEGVLTVDMEASALFAVAQYRNVDAAAGFVISDSLAGGVWDPQIHAAAVREHFALLYRTACTVLLDYGSDRNGNVVVK